MTATPPDLSKLRIDRGLAPIRRRRRRKWIVLGVLALVALGGAGAYFARPHPLDVETTPIVTSYPSQQYVVLNATGYVVAQAQSAEAAVRAARANVRQAEVERDNAAVEFRRNEELVAKNFISRSALDTAKARLDRAQAAVTSAQANLNVALANAKNAEVAVDYTQIRAPFDGVILSKTANVGDLVTPFSNATDSKGAVVSMADMSTLEVEADVSEGSLAKVHVGQPAEIVLDALPDVRFRGHIDRMVPTVDRAKATVMTKVKFDTIDPRVLPEMSAKVSFLSQPVTPEQQKPVVAVNEAAIVQRDGKSVVFVVHDGRAVAVPVTIGTKIGDAIAIQGEVKPGEKVVQKPDATLVNGALVHAAAK
jgi:RND family efflux transporter MFP subunit